MCWFCGEHLLARVFMFCLMVLLVILCCLQCCPINMFEYFKRIKGCIKACFLSCYYKPAKVVPFPMATETLYSNPTTSMAVDVPTLEVQVVWE